MAEESVGGREFPYHDSEGKVHYDGDKGLQEAMKYVNKDCSLSSVVMSVPHLIKALTDVPTPSDKNGMWGSLIPFHSSGATRESLGRQGLGMVRSAGADLVQFMQETMTDYHKGVTNFEAVQNDRFGKGWKCIAGKREGTDVEEGHKIEFANGSAYRNDELGITFYSSLTTYKNLTGKDNLGKVKGHFFTLDKENNAVAHELNVDYNDKVREIGGDTPYKDAAEHYVNVLRENGFLPRFDFNVTKEQFLKMCEDAGVDPNHPKLGWKGGDWSPCDAESYYSLFCDYGMTDPETGKYSPHEPVLHGQKGADAFEKALPENFVEIIGEGVSRYSERKSSEDAMINNAILEYCERSLDAGKMNEKDVNKILKKHGLPTMKEWRNNKNPNPDGPGGGKSTISISEDEADRHRVTIEASRKDGVRFSITDGDYDHIFT